MIFIDSRASDHLRPYFFAKKKKKNILAGKRKREKREITVGESEAAPDSQSGPWLWSEASLAGNLNGSVESDARLSQLGLSWVPERTGRSARLASCYSITIPAVQFSSGRHVFHGNMARR